MQFPGLLTAVVLRSPTFGGKVTSLRSDAALKVPGVKQVVRVPSGIAVVAEHFWAAQLGRAALEVEWDGAGGDFDSEQYLATLRQLVQARGEPAADKGDVEAALAGAATRLEARYELPYLAHAPLSSYRAKHRSVASANRGTPPIAPAIANAVFALTGQRLRTLAFQLREA